MKSCIVALTLIVAINARPDVSHLPTGSYLPASGHIGSGSSHFGTSGFGIGGIGGIGGHGYQSQSHGTFGSGGGYHGGSGSGFHGGAGSTFHGGSGGSLLGGSGGSFHGGSGGSFHGGSGGSFHGGSGGSFHGGSGSSFHGGVSTGFDGFGGSSGFGGAGGFINDQKHVYFYAAPEEYSSSRLRINIIPNSQRNTKIIFVKAPTYGSVVPEINAPHSLSEDKTLVYVLVKRPEDHGGQINIPAGTGVRPSKPEVYFIKYKTQHDAHQQIAGGLQGQHVGAHVPDIGNAASFVSTLESSSSSSSSTHGHDNFGTVGGPSGIDVRSSFTSGSVSGGSHFGPAGASGPY